MSEKFDIFIPEGQQEGTKSIIGKWLKKPGEEVRIHEPIIEISTDKVTMEVAAPESGILLEIIRNEGEEVGPGDVLGRVERRAIGAAKAEAAPAAPRTGKEASTESESRGDLSPAVRKLLKEHNLDAARISGTGKGGRITHEDVERAIAARVGASAGGLKGRLIPHSPIRRQIAAHMVESVTKAPHVTAVFEVDFSAVAKHREKYKQSFDERGAKLTFTPYILQAVCAAVKEAPEVNSRWHDDALEIFDSCNIGVATALGASGLVVPVVKNAQSMDLFGLAKAVSTLIQKARDGALAGEDVRDGTFTISNHGMGGSLLAAPIIINQPQSAILGVGKLEERVSPAQSGEPGAFELRPKAYVTLTIDHRALDGFSANRFLSVFQGFIENYS